MKEETQIKNEGEVANELKAENIENMQKSKTENENKLDNKIDTRMVAFTGLDDAKSPNNGKLTNSIQRNPFMTTSILKKKDGSSPRRFNGGNSPKKCSIKESHEVIYVEKYQQKQKSCSCGCQIF